MLKKHRFYLLGGVLSRDHPSGLQGHAWLQERLRGVSGRGRGGGQRLYVPRAREPALRQGLPEEHLLLGHRGGAAVAYKPERIQGVLKGAKAAVPCAAAAAAVLAGVAQRLGGEQDYFMHKLRLAGEGG